MTSFLFDQSQRLFYAPHTNPLTLFWPDFDHPPNFWISKSQRSVVSRDIRAPPIRTLHFTTDQSQTVSKCVSNLRIPLLRAGSEIQHTFPGYVFPQFTHHGKSNYHCELCSTFLRWAKKNGVKPSAYKSSKVTVDDIINDTAIISFSGVIQVREHLILQRW